MRNFYLLRVGGIVWFLYGVWLVAVYAAFLDSAEDFIRQGISTVLKGW